jgi:hypothetical protein
MHYKKILVLIPLCLAIGFLGCSSKEEKKAGAPKQEKITKNLVPAKAEIAGQNFSAELSDLKVEMTVDTASKEIVDTPRLTGHIKVTNKSKDIIDVQAATVEYLDVAGNQIAFKSGEKISKVTSYWLKIIRPGETVEGSMDATIPRAAVKEKTLGKIEINLVYVPSPLKRETLSLPEKIE